MPVVSAGISRQDRALPGVAQPVVGKPCAGSSPSSPVPRENSRISSRPPHNAGTAPPHDRNPVEQATQMGIARQQDGGAAERQSDRQCNQQAEHNQQGTSRRRACNLLRDRLAADCGHTEITMHQAQYPITVLCDERLVQAETRHAAVTIRSGGCVGAGDDRGDISRQHAASRTPTPDRPIKGRHEQSISRFPTNRMIVHAALPTWFSRSATAAAAV